MMGPYEFAFDAMAAHRRALIAFSFSPVATSAPAMYRTSVPGALEALAKAELAFLSGDGREAMFRLFDAVSYIKGVERHGALALGGTTAQIEGVRRQLMLELRDKG